MKSWIKIGLIAAAGLLALKKRQDTAAYGLDFFTGLINDGKSLSIGEYPFVYEYEFEYNDLGYPKRMKRYTRYKATKNAYNELAKTIPALDYFTQMEYLLDDEVIKQV